MVVIDDQRFPGQYLITCDLHDQDFEFRAENLEQAEKALLRHVSQEHSSGSERIPGMVAAASM